MRSNNINKILITRLGAIGDVVQTLPVVRQLQLNYPSAEIYWVIEKKSYPIVANQSGINFLIFPKEKIKTFNILAGAWNARKFRNLMHSIEFDLAIDLQGLFKSGWIVGNSGAKHKIGFHPANTREGAHLFLDDWLPEVNAKTMHRVDYYQRIIPYLGGQIHRLDDPFQYELSELEQSSHKNLLHRFRVKRPVIFNLGASKATKRWPAEHFGELISLISKRFPKENLLLTGQGNADEIWARKILTILPPGSCESAVSKTNLRDLAILVKHSKCIISCDSLALHLGSAFQIPSIGIFGGSALKIETGPYFNGNSDALDNPMPCYPCRKRICQHHSCMQGLSAQKVASAVSKVLNNLNSTQAIK